MPCQDTKPFLDDAYHVQRQLHDDPGSARFLSADDTQSVGYNSLGQPFVYEPY